ncbi:MAG: UDP-N-acetylglucosamine--N-acetylmuramyl-(pentapeptide) pyrophosphoryl-undecaprenol N-acetylglucosamine transferase [Chlamydiota bacterium]|nr:UDP-N-acetylglucosamine--N-acetylmuramyl-(pentapeptide) pyrophosphoryl-undecaprenol N-acetylglucosamine transferase [Chlamydiota bacterium]
MSKNNPLIIFAAGGTWGHIAPALELEVAIKREHPSWRVIWLGRLPSKLVAGRKEYRLSLSSPYVGSMGKRALSLMQLGWNSLYASFRCLRDSPDVVIGFGSYHAFPTLLAAYCLKIPYFLIESNILAGRVVRLFSKQAETTYLPFPPPSSLLSGSTKQVRFCAPSPSFSSKRKCLLIIGGSQGSHFLNSLMKRIAGDLHRHIPSLRFLHITGKAEWVRPVEDLYLRLGIDADVLAFHERMEEVWPEVEFALCRAGGRTLVELIANHVPALMFPLMTSSEGHQEANARYFVETLRGGRMVRSASPCPSQVMQEIQDVWSKRDFHRRSLAQKNRYDLPDYCEDLMGAIQKKLS